MAKIVLSDEAPKGESIEFSLGAVTFTLDGSKKSASFETDDRNTIEAAAFHPWLTVKFDNVQPVPDYSAEHPTQVPPSQDAYSALGPDAGIPFDPAAVAAVEEPKLDTGENLVALDAGLDQSSVVETDGVAQTLAAADASNDNNKDS